MFHFPVLSSFMTYHLVCIQGNTRGATNQAETAHPSVAPEFTPGVSEVHVARSLVFCVLFYRSLFGLLYFFLLTIVLSVFQFTESDYPFSTFKLFLFSCRSTITLLLSLVEQELQTLPNHLSSSQFFQRIRVSQSSFLCSVVQIIVCPFLFRLLYYSSFLNLRLQITPYFSLYN